MHKSSKSRHGSVHMNVPPRIFIEGDDASNGGSPRGSDDSSGTGRKGGEAPGEASIHVVVRVRPLNQREIEEQTRSVLSVLDQRLVLLQPPQVAKNDFLRHGRVVEKRFTFDSAFGVEASQEDIYAHSTRALLPGVLEGFNATAFAYGATGSGKTYSMTGTPDAPGVMVLTLMALFTQIEEIQSKQEWVYQVTLSLLEVYNEHIRDLLSPNLHSASTIHHDHHGGHHGHHDSLTNNDSGSGAAPPEKSLPPNPNSLDLREDPLKGMVVSGITEVPGIANAEEILALLERGNRNRTTEPTKANQVSSRSHSVLQLVVERHEKTPGIAGTIKIGKLNLIDLAGSERASKTENRGIRLVEGGNINRSLLALANCINALVTAQKNGSIGDSGSTDFIPYRDSKLTRLLKDSLGGHTKTVMISCVSPAESSYEETWNTLKYADRAKQIKTRQGESNEKSFGMQIHQYESIIQALRSEVTQLKGELWMVHQGRAPLSPPINTAPQYRLSRIPSVARTNSGTKEQQQQMREFFPASPKNGGGANGNGNGNGNGVASPSALPFVSIPTSTDEDSATRANRFVSPAARTRSLLNGHATEASIMSPSRLTLPSVVVVPTIQEHSSIQQQYHPSRQHQIQNGAKHHRNHHRRKQRKPHHIPPGIGLGVRSNSGTEDGEDDPELAAAARLIQYNPAMMENGFGNDKEAASISAQSNPSITLPSTLIESFQQYPYLLLRKLLQKTCVEALSLKGRLGETKKQELLVRRQLLQAESSSNDASSADSGSLLSSLPSLSSLQSKLHRRCLFKRSIIDALRRAILDRLAWLNDPVNSNAGRVLPGISDGGAGGGAGQSDLSPKGGQSVAARRLLSPTRNSAAASSSEQSSVPLNARQTLSIDHKSFLAQWKRFDALEREWNHELHSLAVQAALRASEDLSRAQEEMLSGSESVHTSDSLAVLRSKAIATKEAAVALATSMLLQQSNSTDASLPELAAFQSDVQAVKHQGRQRQRGMALGGGGRAESSHLANLSPTHVNGNVNGGGAENISPPPARDPSRRTTNNSNAPTAVPGVPSYLQSTAGSSAKKKERLAAGARNTPTAFPAIGSPTNGQMKAQKAVKVPVASVAVAVPAAEEEEEDAFEI